MASFDWIRFDPDTATGGGGGGSVTDQFEGTFLEDTARCEWSARQEGFAFLSDPAGTSTSVSALIGAERRQ